VSEYKKKDAGILWNKQDGFRIMLPISGNPNKEVPQETIFLISCVLRANEDEKFVPDMLDWFDTNAKEKLKNDNGT